MGLSTDLGSLREIQQAIQSYVLCGDRGAEARVLTTSRVDARTRLDIYAKGYRLRLLEALEEDFRALRASMGEEAFQRLAEDYIDAHPSAHFSLRHFGRHLPRHLSHGEYSASPWLFDLASFEWLLGEAFDAPGATLVTAEALASVTPASWPDMGFTLHPSVRRISLGWNVTRIRLAVESEEPPPGPERSEAAIPWLVWRQGLKTYYRSLEPAEAMSLDRVRDGVTFGNLCEDLCRWVAEDEVAARAAGFLRRWVTDGLVTEIHVA
ncbi:MAG: HvfC/BufC N-terminal domain-containing protein [Gammaproteobacteria bacterium]